MLTRTMLPDAVRTLQDEARAFAASVPRQLLLDMDADRVRFPREFLQEAGRRNLLGLRFDPAWGGRGLPWTTEMVALEELGVLGTALPCLWSLVSIVGEAIAAFGNDEQKRRFLAPMLRGEVAAAEALTEPRGGSDFFAATTTARREGDTFFLSGQKRFVVGAEGADVILVYGRVEGIADPKRAMTAFLLERGDGVEVHHVYGLMGTRGGGTGRLVFKDAPVPLANVLGGEAGVGQGTEVFHRMMIPERLTSAGGAVGMGRAAFEIAARYADRRHAFGEKIRRFEGVSFKIAESLTLMDAARALNHGAARAVDVGEEAGTVRRLVSEAKKFATESAWTVVNHAMQVLGGIGYTDIYPVERLLRDTRLITIWTGTNEIMDLVIQHEFYRQFLAAKASGRDVEADAAGSALPDEKVYNEPE
ncbi:MAG: acyl-CoA dehydrogenase [Acidobacteria bacterium 37-71-11]|nr:MAG: acyl-CoA dehydrogenase [Acidobacteria bacterium 37-71-11]HQT96174.1 acyl-CoA dehydrogenase family protein [Thermoanaerobaculaceae bacterium]